MAKGSTVPFDMCPCGKRGWHDERDAEKALGRARAKRNRQYDKNGMSRRGMVRENRLYLCHEGDLYHLTSQSARENRVQMGEETPSLTWDQWLAKQDKQVSNVVYLADRRMAA